MKKFILILFFLTSLFSVDFQTYKDYANQLIKFNLKIDTPIFDPFKEEVVKKVVKKKKVIKKVVKKKKVIRRIEVVINLLAIVNDKVLLYIKDENGEDKRWIKKDEVFKGYKLLKIANSYWHSKVTKKKKEKIVRLYNNKFNIKVYR